MSSIVKQYHLPTPQVVLLFFTMRVVFKMYEFHNVYAVLDSDPCLIEDCSNHGICSADDYGFSACTCNDGYTGIECQCKYYVVYL